MQKLDRKMRKLLPNQVQHYPKADEDPLYVHRKQGRWGLMQLEEAYTVEITKLVEYIDSKEDPLIQTQNVPHIINSAELQTVRCLKTAVQRGTRQIKDSIAEKTKEIWQGKWIIAI